jgi:hypothetical protein
LAKQESLGNAQQKSVTHIIGHRRPGMENPGYAASPWQHAHFHVFDFDAFGLQKEQNAYVLVLQ